MLFSKRTTTTIAVFVIIIGAILIVSQTPQERGIQNVKSIKVGAILPLSGGGFGTLGEEVRKGAEMARKEIENAQDISFNVIYEDSQNFSPKAAVNAANKLVYADRVDASLILTIEESKVTAKTFNDAKISAIILWDANEFLRTAGEYIFSNGFSTERGGELMAEYAYRKLGARNVGVVSNLEPWGEIIAEAFIKKFKELGGAVLIHEALAVETPDYRTTVLKLKNLNVDGIYFPLLMPGAYVNFLKNTRELGFMVPLMTGDAFIQEAITEARATAEAVYLTDIYTDKEEELTEKYRTQYGKESVDIRFFSFGYEGLYKLAEGFKIANEKEISVQEALLEIFGPTRSADRVEKIYQVNNGKTIPVE